ncbi:MULTISPECIES: phosphodiesterase [Pectobacterium]|jgi:Icc protein|uniref:Phosphodiesterase n=1 Tax=Pectobacterium versatile TaxID=2488639 RepID=A0AAW3RXK8_9GAMM|nr:MULTISPECIES: phosphodiesterase [Pectobacterium]ASN87098.1 Metallophosphatase family phosphodiesterase [Pectobacterium versatile]ATV44038.1 phosphodiesterase [Pectobacterium brasiliense]MBA0160904.1 phosphodiesterase [Pectobacterium versatile]MBA0163446.1 phosphodiesterase [Pectobacterium versatile]MBN3058293.1 phosphodiesterase [Pectobacterium versatile]
MLLAQISDLHFRSEGRKLYEFIDINGENAKVINQLNALSERPDAVVVSGDIVNCGSPQEYQVAQRVLQMLDYPMYVIPGNHDDKQHFLNAMRPLCPQLGDDPENIRYAVDDFPMRLLFIDTSLAGQAKGWLTPSTLGWLEQQLQDHSTRETAIFMHHPPLPLGSAHMDRIACENGHELLTLIERFPQLTRIFCGHTHRLIMTQHRQAIIATVPGTVHQVPYFYYDDTSYYNLEPASVVMHRYVPVTGLVSYSQSIASYPGPYLYDPRISCPVDA